jgi:hypothetical protein
MSKNIVRALLFTHLVGFYFCNHNNIHWITCIISYSNFIIYNLLYSESVNNIRFALSISPKNYIEPLHGSHKLISYGISTIHALFIASCAALYLLNIFDNYAIKQAYFISISYYSADIYYVIDSTKKLTKLDYFTVCHHIVMILMYSVIFIEINNDINLENSLLYYMNRGLLAEFSVFTLNYSWYLVNTKQNNSNKMMIFSILTLILYFITRIVNFTILIYNFWNDDLLPAIALMLPLFLINYYWFYKLMCKALCIYNKSRI